MSNHIYKWKYTSATDYKILQIRKPITDNRFVSADHPDYLLFLSEGNIPEVIPYVPPTPESLADLKKRRKRELNMNADMHINNTYDQTKQIRASLLVWNVAKRDEIGNFIKAVLVQVNTLEAEIEACTTKEQVNQININPWG